MACLVSAAQRLAHNLLSNELPDRWLHVTGVGERAQLFRRALEPVHSEVLEAAAFVHDVGYCSEAKATGFHAIDGARYLRRLGYPEPVVSLVAHHTCSHIEAGLRGMAWDLWQEFPRGADLPHDELLFCDLTVGPTGEIISVPERLREIRSRYGPSDTVHRFIDLAEADLLAAANRAESLLPLAASPAA